MTRRERSGMAGAMGGKRFGEEGVRLRKPVLLQRQAMIHRRNDVPVLMLKPTARPSSVAITRLRGSDVRVVCWPAGAGTQDRDSGAEHDR